MRDTIPCAMHENIAAQNMDCNTYQWKGIYFIWIKASQQCLLHVIPQNCAEMHRVVAIPITNHSLLQIPGMHICRIGYDVCELCSLRATKSILWIEYVSTIEICSIQHIRLRWKAMWLFGEVVWLIMLVIMDLRRPRVCMRSSSTLFRNVANREKKTLPPPPPPTPQIRKKQFLYAKAWIKHY